VHGQLVDAWGAPRNLPDSYVWRWYAYHLAAAGRQAELRGLLLDPEWLRAKLAATDVISLTADFDRLTEDEDLHLVQGAIRLSGHAIGRDAGQFNSQMMGRLLPYRDTPAIERFTARVAEGSGASWLRPMQAALHPPGTGLIRTLKGHPGAVTGVAVSSDGRLAVSTALDETLTVWDVGSGRELRVLEDHFDQVHSVASSGDGRRALSVDDGWSREEAQ
jgi:WD40 repeat protein